MSSSIEQTIQEYKSSVIFGLGWVGAVVMNSILEDQVAQKTAKTEDGAGGRGSRLVAGRPGVRDIVEGAGDGLFRSHILR